MEEDEENVLTEDLDVGENFNVDIKPDLPLYKHKDRYKKLRIPGPRNRCPYGCLKFLAPRTIDYHRTNGCRMSTEDPLGETSKKRNFCCGVCYAEFITRPGFLQHLKVEHDVDAEVHQVIFKDRAMFDRFVKWMEMEGGAHFRHKSGSKRRASGKGIFMACNRSGYVGGTGAAVDPVKNRTGPFRTGYSCTAFIHGSELPNGRVQVEMCGDHYGHDARMRLPNVVKQLVAQKQLEGEMPQDIVSYLKRQFSHFAHENIYAQRVCLVDHEELRSLMFSTTKKWEQSGIPTECELWEEELLDRAGILREGVPRLRPLTEPTTQQVAEREMWPRPRVFVAKMRTENGFVELPELCKATAEARRQSVVHNTDAFEEVAQHAQDPFRVSDIQPKKELPDEVEETGIEEDTSMNDSGGEIVVDDRGTPPPLVVRERQVRPSSAERRRSVNRQLVVSNIFSELEHIDRVVQVDGSSISDSSLISFLNRLRQARQGLTNSVNVRANTNGHRAGRLVTSPLLNSVVDRMQQANRGAAAHRRAQAGLQGAQSAERRPPRLMKTEILTLADIEMSLSRLALDLCRMSVARVAAPRQFSCTPRVMDSIRDNHRQGTRLVGAQQETFEGTAGANQATSVNLQGIDTRFPTPETLKQDFGGTPFCELPIVYIKATKNNTLVTVTDHKNQMITYTSCRLEGFKNARKKTTIAGQTTGVAAGQRLVRRGIRTVRVQVKGLGPGRMTCVKGLTVAGVDVVSITDHTPLPELGPRPRKIRRI